MALIKFNRDWMHFAKDQVVDIPPGKADAFVNYSHVAEYVDTTATDSDEPPVRRGPRRPPNVLTRRNPGPREQED